MFQVFFSSQFWVYVLNNCWNMNSIMREQSVVRIQIKVDEYSDDKKGILQKDQREHSSFQV
jgi:hypothetical protein